MPRTIGSIRRHCQHAACRAIHRRRHSGRSLFSTDPSMANASRCVVRRRDNRDCHVSHQPGQVFCDSSRCAEHRRARNVSPCSTSDLLGRIRSRFRMLAGEANAEPCLDSDRRPALHCCANSRRGTTANTNRRLPPIQRASGLATRARCLVGESWFRRLPI